MKKTFLAILIASLALVTISSCKKTVKALFPGATTDLPEVMNTLPTLDSLRLAPYPVTELPLHTAFPLPQITQHFNLDSIVKANTGNNFGAGDITSVKLNQIKLKILTGADANNNISNFESAAFSFSSSSNSTPTTVTNVSFADVYATEKTIPGDNSLELRPYLSGTELYYNVSASLRRHTTHPIKISIIATVTMK